MELEVTTTANDGRTIKMTARQARAIETLTNTRKGGCGSVIGYRPTTNWDVSPVQDIQLITHFSTEALYRRRMEALEAVEFKDVTRYLAGDPKLGNMTIVECHDVFKRRKAKEIATLQKTLDGDRNDPHRAAHDRCYAQVGDVKVHLVTEKVDGLKEPVMDGDAVIVDTIMVPYIQLNVTTRTEGKRKERNSGAEVRMSNLINRALNKSSVVYKTLSLKPDNFEAFRTDRQEFLPEEMTRFGDIISE